MSNKHAGLIAVAAIGFVLAACGSDSDDVPSLDATPTAAAEDAVLDDEAKVMAFTQCMRDQGIEYEDPVVDSDGSVQQPQLAEGVEMTREELAAPYQACAHHLEGVTFGRDRGERGSRYRRAPTAFSPSLTLRRGTHNIPVTAMKVQA